MEPKFHPDSYGYRPGKSALDAVGMARRRCWDADWVIDLDIKSFFDSIPHDLVERAVAHHTESPWVRLYIARWLRAPCRKQTALWSNGREARRKAESSVLCWPISSCTTRSISGCSGSFRKFSSSVMRTTPSSIAEANGRLVRYWRPFGIASFSAVWNFMQRRHRSCIAMMTIGLGTRNRLSSIFSGTPSNLGGRTIVGKVFCELSSGDERQGCQSGSGHHPGMADGFHAQPAPGRFGPARQPCCAWLDELLWAVLPLEMCTSPACLNEVLAAWARRKYRKFRRREHASMYWLGRIARRDRTLFAHWALGVMPEAGS